MTVVTAFIAGIPLLLVVLGIFALRHHHRWSAWTDAMRLSPSSFIQERSCKDRGCNILQTRNARL